MHKNKWCQNVHPSIIYSRINKKLLRKLRKIYKIYNIQIHKMFRFLSNIVGESFKKYLIIIELLYLTRV